MINTDTLSGWDIANHLYRHAGDDELTFGKGNDILLGNVLSFSNKQLQAPHGYWVLAKWHIFEQNEHLTASNDYEWRVVT